MKLDLNAGQGIRVTGPAKLRVIQGILSILGTNLQVNQEIIIQSGKQFPFEVKSAATLELIGSNIKYKIPDYPLIPHDREDVTEKISKIPTPVKIIVLGDIDTGKTTVICYLANFFFNSGKKVAVIDLDTGQQDIGPPGTITLGILDQPIITLGDIPLNRMVFIGKTSPMGRMVQILAGANELMGYALTLADIILIDTTGWVLGGAARALKSAKIRSLKPQMIVALQKENEIDHILQPFESSSIQIEKLSVHPHIKGRNSKTRKFLRESKFNKYFSNASSRLLNLQELRIENSFFHSGQRLNETDLQFTEQTLECHFIYAEKAADALFLVKKHASFYNKDKIQSVREHFGIQEIRIVDKNEESGLILGLLDKDLNTLGIGLIENISYEKNTIRVFTPVTERIKILQFGFLKITKTGEEIPDQKLSF